MDGRMNENRRRRAGSVLVMAGVLLVLVFVRGCGANVAQPLLLFVEFITIPGVDAPWACLTLINSGNTVIFYAPSVVKGTAETINGIEPLLMTSPAIGPGTLAPRAAERRYVELPVGTIRWSAYMHGYRGSAVSRMCWRLLGWNGTPAWLGRLIEKSARKGRFQITTEMLTNLPPVTGLRPTAGE